MSDDSKVVFVRAETSLPKIWSETVGALVFDVLKSANTVAKAREALGLGSMALQHANRVDVKGGSIDNTTVGLAKPAQAEFVKAKVLSPILQPTQAINKNYALANVGGVTGGYLLVGIVDAVWSGDYIDDTFEGDSGVLLQDHISDSGIQWKLAGSVDDIAGYDTLVLSGDGVVYSENNGVTNAYLELVLPATYTLLADFNFVNEVASSETALAYYTLYLDMPIDTINTADWYAPPYRLNFEFEPNFGWSYISGNVLEYYPNGVLSPGNHELRIDVTETEYITALDGFEIFREARTNTMPGYLAARINTRQAYADGLSRNCNPAEFTRVRIVQDTSSLPPIEQPAQPMLFDTFTGPIAFLPERATDSGHTWSQLGTVGATKQIRLSGDGTAFVANGINDVVAMVELPPLFSILFEMQIDSRAAGYEGSYFQFHLGLPPSVMDNPTAWTIGGTPPKRTFDISMDPLYGTCKIGLTSALYDIPTPLDGLFTVRIDVLEFEYKIGIGGFNSMEVTNLLRQTGDVPEPSVLGWRVISTGAFNAEVNRRLCFAEPTSLKVVATNSLAPMQAPPLGG